jgi:hypothetical protein
MKFRDLLDAYPTDTREAVCYDAGSVLCDSRMVAAFDAGDEAEMGRLLAAHIEAALESFDGDLYDANESRRSVDAAETREAVREMRKALA